MNPHSTRHKNRHPQTTPQVPDKGQRCLPPRVQRPRNSTPRAEPAQKPQRRPKRAEKSSSRTRRRAAAAAAAQELTGDKTPWRQLPADALAPAQRARAAPQPQPPADAICATQTAKLCRGRQQASEPRLQGQVQCRTCTSSPRPRTVTPAPPPQPRSACRAGKTPKLGLTRNSRRTMTENPARAISLASPKYQVLHRRNPPLSKEVSAPGDAHPSFGAH